MAARNRRIILENSVLEASCDETAQIWHIEDKRTGKIWQGLKTPSSAGAKVVKRGKEDLLLELRVGNESYLAHWMLDGKDAILSCEIASDNKDGGRKKMPDDLTYPGTLYSGQKDKQLFMEWVIPTYEGLLFSAGDSPHGIGHRLRGNTGCAGLSMSFFGALDRGAGYIAIIDTPEDMYLWIRAEKLDDNTEICGTTPGWLSEKGYLGYNRKIIYQFIPEGGYVKLAKLYREHVEKRGLFKSLREKIAGNPNVEKLLGAVDVWVMSKESKFKEVVDCLEKSGVSRMLVNLPGNEKITEEKSYLIGTYDLYQDCYEPGVSNRLCHSGFQWPDDLLLDEKGKPVFAWAMAKEGKVHIGNMVCPVRRVEAERIRIPRMRKNQKYSAWFLDCTTAGKSMECYHGKHPLTRREFKKFQVQELEFASKDMKLVTGSEDGADWAIPYLTYFEGVESIYNFRISACGGIIDLYATSPVPWHTRDEVEEPQPQIVEWQLGPYRRIPLFQLVYHDAVVSTRYWHDFSNMYPKYPELWKKKDLFSMLYGTMPIWLITDGKYEMQKDLFAKSYQELNPFLEKIGLDELLWHRPLTADRSVQESVFSSGYRVRVNFGGRPYQDKGQEAIPPLGYQIDRIEPAKEMPAAVDIPYILKWRLSSRDGKTGILAVIAVKDKPLKMVLRPTGFPEAWGAPECFKVEVDEIEEIFIPLKISRTDKPLSARLECEPAGGVIVDRPINVLESYRAKDRVDINSELAEWHDIEGVMIERQDQVKNGTKTDWDGTFKGEIKSLWDDENLYLGIKVWDRDIRQNKRAGNLCQGDAVEVFLNCDENSYADFLGERDCQIVFAPRTAEHPFDEWEIAGNRQIAGLQMQSTLTSGGYTMQIKIPWHSLKVEPKTGRTIGFDAALDDAKGQFERNYQMVWSGSWNNFRSKEKWGTIVLKE